MTQAPSEPTNVVLDQLGAMRAEARATRAETNARFDKIEAYVSGIKREVHGFELNAIAQVYEANLTVAASSIANDG